MEERFELFGKHCIKDNSPDARRQLLDVYVACVILNEQDIHIKKLEEENQQLKQTQEQQVREKVVEDIRNQLKNMDFLASAWELGERCSCYSKYKVLDILLKVEKDQVKGEKNE